MKYISFNIPKCFLYLILIAITRTITDYIRNYGERYFKFAIFRLFLMFIGQLFVIAFYLIQKKILNKQFNENNYSLISEETNIINKKYKYLQFLFFFVTLLAFFGELNWSSLFYNYEMLKVN